MDHHHQNDQNQKNKVHPSAISALITKRTQKEQGPQGCTMFLDRLNRSRVSLYLGLSLRITLVKVFSMLTPKYAVLATGSCTEGFKQHSNKATKQQSTKELEGLELNKWKDQQQIALALHS